jgi:hypothetical protein
MEQQQNRNKMMKPQTNTVSKYWEDNTQNKFDMKYTHIIQDVYNKRSWDSSVV